MPTFIHLYHYYRWNSSFKFLLLDWSLITLKTLLYNNWVSLNNTYNWSNLALLNGSRLRFLFDLISDVYNCIRTFTTNESFGLLILKNGRFSCIDSFEFVFFFVFFFVIIFLFPVIYFKFECIDFRVLIMTHINSEGRTKTPWLKRKNLMMNSFWNWDLFAFT